MEMFKDLSEPVNQLGNISEPVNQLEDISRSVNQVKENIVPSHEKLWVWQKSHKLMLQIHTISNGFPLDERFRLKDQVRRSSKSVPDNVAEGCNSYYYNEKIRGYRHARKEAGETQNHIREMQKKKYISTKEAEAIIYEYEEVIRGLNGLVRYYNKKRDNSKLRGHHRK